VPIMLAYGTISADFLDIALHLFLGFWAIMIVVAAGYFSYVLIVVKARKRSK
jgi:hypothetical protein